MPAGAAEKRAMVIGAGPNGLSAAIVLAQAQWQVTVYEAAETVGGGARSGECTLPGYVHDICSAVYPLGIGSPFFNTLPLDRHGLEWIQPTLALAHPLDDGTAGVLDRSMQRTVESFQSERDAQRHRRVFEPLAAQWNELAHGVLQPLHLPRHPGVMLRFGIRAIRSAAGLARSLYQNEPARAVFAGMAAHSALRLDQSPSAAFGLLLGVAGHAVGWPIPRGGAQRISDALAGHLIELGGTITTGHRIESLDQLPSCDAYLFDTTPRQLLRIAGNQLPHRYKRQLATFRYGPGVFKIDWALDGTAPWTAPACSEACTLHLGGTLDEIANAERAVIAGEHPERPFVLFAQQSLFDDSRAPAGNHTAWAYCHVPNGSTFDMTERIEKQVERFAPGFRERILARSTINTAQLEAHNANCVGGDINGGMANLRQLFTRPTRRIPPYTTPNHKVFLCSSSTPPGGGVHGMCGYYAAQRVLARS